MGLEIFALFCFGPLPVGLFHVLFRWLQDADLEAGIIPPRGSRIKGSLQKFLHVQDFATMTWGDLIGLSLVWATSMMMVFVQANWSRPSAFWITVIGVVVALVAGFGFHTMCLGPNHKPDYGFPSAGVASPAGKAHSVFFGLSFGVGVMGLLFFIIQYDRTSFMIKTPLLWVWGLGLAVWCAAGLRDIMTGRFAPFQEHGPIMINLTRRCPKCDSDRYVVEPPGYRCKGCGVHF